MGSPPPEKWEQSGREMAIVWSCTATFSWQMSTLSSWQHRDTHGVNTTATPTYIGLPESHSKEGGIWRHMVKVNIGNVLETQLQGLTCELKTRSSSTGLHPPGRGINCCWSYCSHISYTSIKRERLLFSRYCRAQDTFASERLYIRSS